MIASGRSMVPTIRPGDVLFVERDGRARVGEVAVLRKPEGLVVHRLISKRPAREMGDGARTASHYRPEHVVGRVIAIARGGRTESLTAPLGRLRGLARVAGAHRRLVIRKLARMRTAQAGALKGGGST